MEYTDLELYIQIRDGQPYEHPIFADNFREAFPGIDTNDLPTDRFAKFIRVAPPVLDTHEVYEGVTYQWVDGIVKDVHLVRQMTDEERAEKDALLAQEAIGRANYALRSRMERCQQTADETEDATQKQYWLDCLEAHKLWVMESADPIAPMFPLFPKLDEGGNWVSRITI